MIPTLETERLLLRPYRIQDFDAFAAMWGDPDVVRFVGGHAHSREQSWARFLRQTGLWPMLGFGSLIVEEKATGAFAGQAGFHDLLRDITPSLVGTMETGWVLARSAHGRGLAEEAARAVLAWADDALPQLRKTAIIDADHAASLRVAQKLGFHEYARSPYHGRSMVMLERVREPGK